MNEVSESMNGVYEVKATNVSEMKRRGYLSDSDSIAKSLSDSEIMLERQRQAPKGVK